MTALSKATAALRLLVLDAEHLDLPEPRHTGITRDGAIEVHLDSLADITAWSLWAEAPISQDGCGLYVRSALTTNYRDHELSVVSMDAKAKAGATC